MQVGPPCRPRVVEVGERALLEVRLVPWLGDDAVRVSRHYLGNTVDPLRRVEPSITGLDVRRPPNVVYRPNLESNRAVTGAWS